MPRLVHDPCAQIVSLKLMQTVETYKTRRVQAGSHMFPFPIIEKVAVEGSMINFWFIHSII